MKRGEGGVLLDSGSKRLPRRGPEVVTCKRSGRVGEERWLQLGRVCVRDLRVGGQCPVISSS